MKKTFFKNLFRDIKNTPSRFLSIVIIIAVGVAFYAGVRATSPDMKISADYYFDKNNLMDFKLVSTLGITQGDIEAVGKEKGITEVEGSYSLDGVIEQDNKQLVLNINSLPKEGGINELRVVGGRKPEKVNETIAEENFLIENNLKIGDKVTLQSGTDTNISNNLNQTKFEILGSAKSPIYLSEQRQISTVGNGSVRGFLYILPEVFKNEVYTEMYARTESKESKNSMIDHKDYVNYTDDIDKNLKDLGVVRNKIRRDEVLKEANDKLQEGEQELAESKLKAQQEIADGRAKLKDAQVKIDDGRNEIKKNEKLLNSEIAKGRRELEDGRAKIKAGEKEIAKNRTEIANGKAKIQVEKKKLEDGEAKLNAEAKKLEPARAELAPGIKEIESAKQKIAAGEKEINARKAEIQNGKAKIQQTKKELNNAEAQISKGKQQAAGGINQAMYAEVLKAEQLANSDPTNENYVAQYQAISSLYEGNINGKNFDQIYSSLKTNGLLGSIQGFDIEKMNSDFINSQAQIDGGRAQISEQEKVLNQGQAKLNEEAKKLEASKNQLAPEIQKIESAKAQIAAGESQISKSRADIQKGKSQIAKEEKKLQDGEAKLNSEAKKLEASKKDISKGEGDIEREKKDGLRKIANAKVDIQKGQAEIDENLKKLNSEEEDANKKILEAEAEIKKSRDKIDEIKEPEWYVLGRNQNVGYETYRQDSDRIDNIGKVFPLIFFLVAALVSLTTMTRMVQEKRTEIGTFKAIGYSPLAIVSHYLIYSLMSSVMGSIIGIFIGFRLFPPLIINAYGSLYALPDVLTPFNVSLAIQASLIAIVFTTLAATLATLDELREVPASLMRPKPPKAGKKILLERANFIWSRLKFTQKVTARNIFRYKQRFLMTVIGIAACTGLMITAYGLKEGIVGATEAQFNDIYKYDMQGNLNKDKTQAEKEDIKNRALKDQNIDSILFANSKSGTIESKDVRSEDVYVVVPEDTEEFNDYIKLYLNEQDLKLGDEGIILTEKLSRLIDKKVGDTVEITLEDEIVEAKVAAITQQYIQHYAYMSPTYYQQITGKNMAYNSFYGTLKDVSEQAENDTSSRLKSIGGINSISFKNNSKVDSDKSVESINSVVLILIVSAGVLAFVVIYNLTNINITERRRELATIKLLGFYDKELAAYIYRENIILTLIGSFTGIFVGLFLNKFVLSTAETNVIKFLEKISPIYFVYSILLTLLFSVIVNLAMYKRFGKIDMIESLKSAE